MALTFSSCKNELDDYQLNFEYGYFPLEIGKYKVYQVDSVIFDPLSSGVEVDSSTTFFKEIVVDTFTNSTGLLQYRLERFERTADSLPWVVTTVFSQALDNQTALHIEDNLTFLKLLFPLEVGERWNGNIFLDEEVIISVAGESLQMFKDWNYETLEISTNEVLGEYTFDEVVHISQVDFENLLDLRISFEKYAKGVGLVYREMHILDTQNISEELPWAQKAEKGFILKQTILDYN
ncbi:MAG: hypothetical protein GY705_02600 [Bacteroidetes bacterium]|nr:hypothetical protein [Bacteroidota bacterium]